MPNTAHLLVYVIALGLSIVLKGNTVENGNADRMPGHIVDNFAVGELLAPDNADLIPADITELDVLEKNTFEKGTGLTPPGSLDRDYTKNFSKRRSRFICWEITLDHAPVANNRDLNLQFRLQNDNNQQLMTGKVDSWIPANSDVTTHSACWGWPYADLWQPGKYQFEVLPAGEEPAGETDIFASIPFTVEQR